MNSNYESPNGIGWNFPPTGGGVQDGWNNPGAAHFKGNRLHHLAREILQNSLDARDSSDKPVSVTFEVKNFDREQVEGVDELIEHIDACILKCQENDQYDHELELRQAKEIFESDSITFLKVYDSNTTGLKANRWNALVKGSGTSIKSNNTAGGSHGIGKNAAFVISPARTAYYWTAYKSDSPNSQYIEKFQGKSVLMYHTVDNEERQGVGFWGDLRNCSELSGQEIPEQFRIVDNLQQPIQGTAIWIAGFRSDSGWQDQIASLVIENFFCAIHQKSLEVILEPEAACDTLFHIDATTLESWLDKLDELGGEEFSDIARNTRVYLKFLKNESSAIEHEDEDLGVCKLWIELGDNYPRHVALVRNTGMLITTSQPNTTNFRSIHDFIALCLFQCPEGNKFLRDMENPQHNQFCPDEAPENQRDRSRIALRRLTNWIRSSVREQAKRKKENTSHQLDELAQYLPLNLSEGPLDLDGDGEDSFGEYGQIKQRQIKVKHYPSPIVSPGDDDDDIDDLTPPNGGNGGGGSGGGGTESPEGDKDVWENVRIKDVRILPDRHTKGLYTISFVPEKDANVKLHFQIAGDQNAVNRNSIQVASIAENGEYTLSELPIYSVKKNTRVYLSIYDSNPIENSAWIVKATELANG